MRHMRHLPQCFVLLCAAAIGSSAQTFTTLLNFDGADGTETLYMTLVQGVDGNFYGTTGFGGANGDGTIYKITPGGTLTTLYSFDGTHGVEPLAGLLEGTGGNFYGTTYLGGTHNRGTIFEITPEGTLTTMRSFDYADGDAPFAGLVQAPNGDFYGTTSGGGANNAGTLFKITPQGALTTLYTFSYGPSTNGGNPFGLVQAANGDFYGTTYQGGVSGPGTIFKFTPGGSLTRLYSFAGTDGAYPYAGLLQASDGDFYGTTAAGGTDNSCKFGCGTVFKVTSSGNLTTLHNFKGSDGATPEAVLTQATDGNFYGTTSAGGTDNSGTIFKITPSGHLTTLHSFDSTDGANPHGGLLQSTDGSFYGATYEGGANNYGTVFKLSVGLGPFVKILSTYGNAGATVKILGTDLTGATQVSFNGTPSVFTVVQASEITATVTAGATTGKVQVTTPGGTLSSNVVFRVTP